MTQPTFIEEALQSAAAVSSLIQGEVLGAADACVVLAEASAPLSIEAADVAAAEGTDSGLIVVPHAVDDVVLLTQTCDLQRTTTEEHRCLVAPMMHMSEQFAYEALRGRRPGFAALPWIAPTAVADLSRVTAVERSVLVGAASRGSPRNPEERLHFAETIGRYLARPALPDAVNDVLAPFVKRIADKHDRRSAEGRCAHTVAELRIEATPDLDHREPALNILMLLDEVDLPPLAQEASVRQEEVDRLVEAGLGAAAEAVFQAGNPVAKREAWMAVAECWIKPAVDRVGDVVGVGSVVITVLNGEELSYARSRNAPILDLRYLSTRP
jgi:hypothetical protein